MFIDERGQMKLIDNDVALQQRWASCAFDSLLVPTTQKHVIARMSFLVRVDTLQCVTWLLASRRAMLIIKGLLFNNKSAHPREICCRFLTVHNIIKYAHHRWLACHQASSICVSLSSSITRSCMLDLDLDLASVACMSGMIYMCIIVAMLLLICSHEIYP